MLESFNTDKFEYKRLSSEEQERRGILGRLVGKIADTKNPTRNGRSYSRELWENVFNDPIMQEKIDNHLLLGELGHPEDREEIDISKAAVCMAERPKKGKDGFLYGVFDILNTPNGKLLKSLCDYGCNVAISSRGTGDVIYDDNGNEAVDPDTYVCETFDIVLVPGVEQARLQYVNEALDTKKRNKTLRQRLTEDLNKASEEDKKIMEETLKDLDIDLGEDSDVNYIQRDDVTDASIYQDEEGNYIASYQGNDFSDKSLEALSDKLHNAYDELSKSEDLDESINKERGNKMINEKLVKPSEEDLVPIEAKFAELGLEIEGKGETLFGNTHYQLRKELDHKVTKEDLGPIFDELCELGTDDMPTVCNVGVHKDGDNIISASLDVLEKHIPDKNEELEDNDGWGDEISGELEPIFDELDRVMYEVRNAVRGSYGIRGKNVGDLVAKLNDLSDQLAMKAEEFEEDEDRLDEDTFVRNGKVYNLDNKNGHITVKDKDGNTIDEFNLDDIMKAHSHDSDIEIDESAGNAGLVNQLQEALTKSAKLEKDNLALQEQLSVCNAKEVKMEESLKHYKDAAATLSKASKDNNKLKEDLNSLKVKCNSFDKDLKEKTELLESTKKELEDVKLRVRKSRVNESLNNNKAKDLENNVTKLTEQLNESTKKLEKTTSIAKQYKAALAEAKKLYVTAKAEACGISEADVISNLKESYSFKDIDSICNELAKEKVRMSKLPFRVNESTRLNLKTKGEYINGGNFLDDDVVSPSLLQMLD